ncbi:condensation domain-containing protein [Nonomuraea zeae]|uniref:Carrier domain-containing protein n=1 Tax=Nonomuraea zeae TaxID=1642303 RepID=A0A5S4GUU8_9ACTN|nr:condensation domain-containing protein [Nonomuraea zeae]TMR36713.1 hypothetical protein ETD85_09960 [Nonomuraea zeae]
MNTDNAADALLHVIASVLERPAEEIAARLDESFVGLGATSLDAMEVVDRAEEELRLSIEMGQLLGLAPLSNVLAACLPVAPPAPAAPGGRQGVLPEQEGFLSAERLLGTAINQVSSAELIGPVSLERLAASVRWLVARHEALRSVFTETPEGYVRHVLPADAAQDAAIVHLDAPAASDGDPIRAVHARLTGGTGGPLEAGRPPVAFVLTRLAEQRHLLSLVISRALADGWSAGLLWQELIAHYQGDADPRPAPGLDGLTRRWQDLLGSGRLDELTRARVGQLADYPTIVELPADRPRPADFDFRGDRLEFALDEETRAGVERIATRARITHTGVLLAAWQLVVARRCGLSKFMIGVGVSRRAQASGLQVIAPCVSLVPVRCEITDEEPVERYLERTAAAVAEGATYVDVPISDISRGIPGGRAMADRRRTPLMQVTFLSQEVFLPDEQQAGEVLVRYHDAFSGMIAADAGLSVLRWGETPRLALDYATSVFGADEARGLAESFHATLRELSREYYRPLAGVRTVSGGQRRQLSRWREGGPVDSHGGLWQLFEQRARTQPDSAAVRDGDRELSYGRLLLDAETCSARLAARGVRANDLVLVALPRPVDEIVAVLAVVRLGAAFVLTAPSSAALLATDLRPAAVVSTPSGLPAPDGHRQPSGAVPTPAPADPERVACAIVTDEAHNGVRLPHRAIIALVRGDGAVRRNDRVARRSPPGSAAAVWEIFAPLAAGATIQLAGDPGPTCMVVTAPAFAEPAAFDGVRQVVVAGEPPAPAAVRAVLGRHPKLAISTWYGPHGHPVVTLGPEPAPLGRPVRGSGIVLLDESGGLVPPGAVGELCSVGDGVPVDCLGGAVATKAAFGRHQGLRYHRSGTLARWAASGRLHLLGPREEQVVVHGHRIDLGEIRDRLRACPGVAEAVVGAVDGDRLMAAVILADPHATGPSDPIDVLAGFAATGLPRYMLPSLWAIVPAIPMTPSGRYDLRTLAPLAVSRDQIR